MAIPEALTLNTKQHIFLHVLPDKNIEGGQDRNILKIVINRDVQGVLAQTGLPVCTIQTPITLKAKFLSENKNATCKILWNAPKAVLRRKFMAVNDYIKKEHTLKSIT